MKNYPLIVVHGGVYFDKNDRTEYNPAFEQEYKKHLSEALQAGHNLLKKGKTSQDAVVAAIRVLEDSSYFDAGKGSVRDSDGNITHDASIMRGDACDSGAIAYTSNIKNPIQAASLVMKKTKHVLLVGEGANEFAKENNLELVSDSYFHNPHIDKQAKHGTVGAVAVDTYGTIVAGTSTGGLTNKIKGRVGDSPIIGAGTYAKNGLVGLSATGSGEYFIRTTACARVAHMMEFGSYTLYKAMKTVLNEIVDLGGKGGFIGIDSVKQQILAEYSDNCGGMFYGWIDEKGNSNITIC